MSNRLDDEIAKPSRLNVDALVWAIVTVLIAGIGVIVGLMAVMKNVVGFDLKVIAISALTSLALLFVVEGIFIWLLASQLGWGEPQKPRSMHEVPVREPEPLQPMPQSLSLPEHLPSVDDHTTQTLDPVSAKQQSE